MDDTELWKRADAELVGSRVRETAEHAVQMKWIPIARREGSHKRLGFGSFYEYLRTRLGMGKKVAFDRIRIACALESLPATMQALEDGKLKLCGVRALVQVVVPETEAAWLARTVGRPVHEIEKLVAGLAPGDGPDTPPDPHNLTIERTFELSTQTDALLSQARVMLEKKDGRSLSDDQLLAELAKRAIADIQASTEDKPLHKKVVVNLCPECDSAHQLAAGRWVRIEPSSLTDLDLRKALHVPVSHMGNDRDDIPGPVRREVFVRDHGCCVVPGCPGTHYIHLHHLLHKEHGGPDEAWNIVILCSAHHLAYHAGRLLIRGPSAGNLRFFHSDGTPYGELSPELATV